MPLKSQKFDIAALQPARQSGGKGSGISLLVWVLFLSAFAPSVFAAPKLALATSGGITIAGAAPTYTSSFGTMNALAIGASSITVPAGAALSTGALYYTTLQVSVSAFGGSTGTVKAYVSSNFSGSASSAMIVYGCAAPSACTTSGQFSQLGTSQAGETTLTPTLDKTTNSAVVGIAIFLPDNDGAAAFTGTSALGATITFELILTGNATPTDTVTLQLTNEIVRDAVQLTLATAASGLMVSPASDFSMSFGTVNALGIGPGAGLTTVAQAGGIIYSTPYSLLPIFTDFSSTTASLKACVSTTFTHSTVLTLHDSSTGSAGSFSAISTNCGAATALTGSALDRSTITRYLGLFVSNINGATAFAGLDTASLTYTLTVP